MRAYSRRTLASTSLLMASGLIMLAAAVYVLLGEQAISAPPALWNVAAAVCRAVTGLFGLLAIVSTLTARASESSRHDTISSVASGVVFIAAAVVGLRLVIVITGLGGLALLFAGGTVAVDAFRSRHREPSGEIDVHRLGRLQVDDLKAEAVGQALGHEGAMTGLGRRLDAK
jgi:hypothetical protein